MSTLARLLLTLGVIALTLGPPGLAQRPLPIDGPTVITEPGHYILTRDLTVTSERHAIEITASDVTVDLNGFTIRQMAPPRYRAIQAEYWRNVRVTNGTIYGNVQADTCRPGPPMEGDATFRIDHTKVVNPDGTAVFVSAYQTPCLATIEDNTLVARRGIRVDVSAVRIARNSIQASYEGLSFESHLPSEISDNYFTGAGIIASDFIDSAIRRNRLCRASIAIGVRVIRSTVESNISDRGLLLVAWQSGSGDNQLLGNTVADIRLLNGSCGNTYADNRVFPGSIFDEPGCNIDGGGNVFAPLCEPRPRAYWHRQCLGVAEINGGVDPGRRGRGPRQPNEPGFAEQLIPCAELADLPGCEVIVPDAPSDSCARAEAELAAISFNKLSVRLQDECSVDLRPEGCEAMTVGELIDEAWELILSGDRRDCRLAARCLAAVNQGVALRDGF